MNKKELNKDLLRISGKGIKWSLDKQMAVFNANERNKALYKKAVSLASY